LRRSLELSQAARKSLEDLLAVQTDKTLIAEHEAAALKAELEELKLKHEQDAQELRSQNHRISVVETESRLLVDRKNLLEEQKAQLGRQRAAETEDHLQHIINKLTSEKEEEIAMLRAGYESAIKELQLKQQLAIQVAVDQAEDEKLALYRDRLDRKKNKLAAMREQHEADAHLLEEHEALEEHAHICEREVERLKKQLREATRRVAELEGLLAGAPKVDVQVNEPPVDKSGTFVGAIEGKNDWARAAGREGGGGYHFGDATRSIFTGKVV